MGKDKAVKPPKVPEPPVARGHKQRGAGTVITARPAITTNDGITLKAHERLPFQLLLEFCQREKRPNPRYFPNPPGCRMKVVLEDAKNSKNDLVFCPVDTSESTNVAKDYAALLALHHFQSTIPLERKLPEPYRTSWLQLIGSAPKPATEPTKESASKTNPTKSETSSIMTSTAAVSSAGSDWICESCGKQNFYALKSGIVRTKCIGCSAAKPTQAPEPIVSGNQGNTGKISAAAAPVQKIPPAVQLQLRSERKFASKHDAEQAKMKIRSEKTRKNDYFNALRRANRPTNVTLSKQLIHLLEDGLGLRASSSSYSSSSSGTEEGELFNVSSIEELLETYENDVLYAEEECGLPEECQETLLSAVYVDLLQLGFESHSILTCLAEFFVKESSEVMLERLSTASALAIPERQKLYTSTLTDEIVRRLCVRLEDYELPEQFRARSTVSSKLSVVATVPTPQQGVKQIGNVVEKAQLSEELLNLKRYGWSEGAIAAVSSAVTVYTEAGGVTLTEADMVFAVAYLLISGLREKRPSLAPLFQAATDTDMLQSISPIEEELESLQAIFDSGFQATKHDDGFFNHTEVSIDVSCSSAAVDFLISNKLSLPLALVRVAASKNDTSCGLQNDLAGYVASLEPDSVSLFQIYTQVTDNLDAMLLSATKVNNRRANEDLMSRFASMGIEDESSTVADTTVADENGSSVGDASRSAGGKAAAGRRPQTVSSFWIRSKNKAQKPSAAPSAQLQSMLEGRQRLPAWKMRDELLALCSNNRSFLVTGETGCGKTTQVPQFILENDSNAKIVICQPRRLAAIGVATRVAEEMVTPVGQEVGYMVKGDSKVSARTQVIFCTYGVLLRRLQDDPTLEAIDYIILDEVHERGMDSDFTLALLMDAMKARSSLKLILMSATIATDKFASYIQKELHVAIVPILTIPGFTHPVSEYYKGDFEDAVRSTAITLPESVFQRHNVYDDYDDDDAAGADAAAKAAGYLIGGVKRKGDFDYDLLVRLIIVLATSKTSSNSKHNVHASFKDTASGGAEMMLARATGSILVFVPGIPEITRVLNLLQTHWAYNHQVKLKLLPLHGNLSPNEQKKVFLPSGVNELKIVVATNVAEASITIPDVTVVIDTCKVKEMEYYVEREMSSLVTKFAARDSLQQRKGRAGRVQHGRCFRLITLGTFTKQPLHGAPEILRSSLDNVILQIKAMPNAPDCHHLLAHCVDFPPVDSINHAIANLVQIQALDGMTQQLTALGRHLSRLPCNPRIGKLLIYGTMFGCAFPASCVAACLVERSPFVTSADSTIQQKINHAKEVFSAGEGSNVKSDYNVYVVALQRYNASNNPRSFCKEYGLSHERMNDIRQTQRDLLESMVEVGFLSSVQEGLNLKSAGSNSNAENRALISAIYCAGLYPSIARVMFPPKRFIEVIGGAVERGTEAKEIKYFVPADKSNTAAGTEPAESNEHSDKWKETNADIATDELQRVFVHPSSINFNNSHMKLCNYVLYGERQLVTQIATNTTKIFVRDTSEISPIALLLFGGMLSMDYTKQIVTIDGWIRLGINGRTFAIMEALRSKMNTVLASRFSEDDKKGSDAEVVISLVARLLSS